MKFYLMAVILVAFIAITLTDGSNKHHGHVKKHKHVKSHGHVKKHEHVKSHGHVKNHRVKHHGEVKRLQLITKEKSVHSLREKASKEIRSGPFDFIINFVNGIIGALNKMLSIIGFELPTLPGGAEATTQAVEEPATEAPATEAPETEEPETDEPETEAPETDEPETEAPETEAPAPAETTTAA